MTCEELLHNSEQLRKTIIFKNHKNFQKELVKNTMGRIKSKVVKRTTHSLLKDEENANIFTGKFEENKEILKGLGLTPSKKVRNQISGFVTRIRKKDIQKR